MYVCMYIYIYICIYIYVLYIYIYIYVYASQSPQRLPSLHNTLVYRQGDESLCPRRVVRVPGNPAPIRNEAGTP